MSKPTGVAWVQGILFIEKVPLNEKEAHDGSSEASFLEISGFE